MWNEMSTMVQFLAVYAIVGILYAILMVVVIEYTLRRKEKFDSDVVVKLLRIVEVPVAAVAFMSFFLWPYLLCLTVLDIVKRRTA